MNPEFWRKRKVLLTGHTGFKGAWLALWADHRRETGLLLVDSAKARRQPGWRPRWNIQRTLDSILEWHRARAAGDDLRQVTLQQIAAYESSLDATPTTPERSATP